MIQAVNTTGWASRDFLFAAAIHEACNSLAVISGYNELFNPENIETLRPLLDDEIDRIRDILMLCAGGFRTDRIGPVSLQSVIATVVQHLRPLCEAKGICLLAEGPDAIVQAHQSGLEQIVKNLVGNALREVGAGDAISVHTTLGGADASMRVHNTGSAISRDRLGGIFEPGFTTTPLSHGLGLAWVRYLVESYGGKISAASDCTGTEFVVHLPGGTSLQ